MAAISQPSRISAGGSPRSRHSVQQGPSSTYTAPAAPGEHYVPAHPTALHTADGDAFNVDPAVPYIASGGSAVHQTPVAESSRSGSKRFSRFTSLARRAMRQKSLGESSQRRAEEGQPFASARSPSPPAISPGTSSSNTIHDTVDDYEGTTAVSHDAIPGAPDIGSPVYIEPQPTIDYAKMDSPRISIASIGSYISRVQQFFRDLNELPWVAERITVDYVPGETKGRRQARERRLQRPISWYGDTPHARILPQLFSDTTSPTSQPEVRQIQAQQSTPFPPDFTRSLSQQQQQQEAIPQEPRAPTPPPEVTFEIIDPAHPSDAPYADIVSAEWSLGLSDPAAPAPHPPNQSTLRSGPRPDVPAWAQQTLFPAPGTLGSDGYQRFVPTGETFPTGFVRHADVESATAAFGDRRFHPQDPEPRPSSPQTRPVTIVPASTANMVWPEGDVVPRNTHSHAPSVPAPALVASQTPYTGYTSPHVNLVSFGSPPSGPPSIAPSRHSRTAFTSPGPSQLRSMGQTHTRPPSAATSHASDAPPAATPASQTLNRPPSAAPSYTSRTPSAAPHMSQTPNRPPSAAPSQASRAPSVTSTHRSTSGQPTPRQRTPSSMQYPLSSAAV
ncbi:hypothetical protein DXG01_004775 [Tephrocybe rancida]|nr:hypothetical protein DXG01_004775 [Tephrocybe rancida]